MAVSLVFFVGLLTVGVDLSLTFLPSIETLLFLLGSLAQSQYELLFTVLLCLCFSWLMALGILLFSEGE